MVGLVAFFLYSALEPSHLNALPVPMLSSLHYSLKQTEK